MDEVLPMNAEAREAEMQTAIDEWISEMRELREDMHRRDAAIEEDRRQTRAVLGEIATVLAGLKAA